MILKQHLIEYKDNEKPNPSAMLGRMERAGACSIKFNGAVCEDNADIQETEMERDLSLTRLFIPKYRKKVLCGKLRTDVREIISTLCRYKDVEIIDGAVCEGYIHLSVAMPPKISISSI